MLAIGNSIGIPFQRVAGGGFTGLFDQYGYPAFGASMRLLGINYTGGLVRVRAFDGSADQGTADVMPYDDGSGEQFVSLSSTITNLDATAAARTPVPTTLGELVDAGGANYDGFVTTWYDQSGNANNATQSTASNQPQIVSSGALILENGKPAFDTLGNKYIATPNFTAISQPVTIFTVHKIASTSGVVIGSNPTGSGRLLIYSSPITTGKTYFAGGPLREASYLGLNSQLLETFLANTTASVIRSNGVEIVSGNAGTNTLNRISFGAYADGSFAGITIHQEAIYYDSDKTLDFTNVETNINNAFTIY